MKESILWISYMRVFATISIVLCHVVCWYYFIPGHNLLPQLFNIGVPIFIFISGWLFGMRWNSEERVLGWCKRFLKISTPVWIVIVMLAVFKQVSIRTFLVCAFDLQGLSFLHPSLRCFNGGAYLAQTWFVTVILLCYSMIPCLKKLKTMDILCGKFVIAIWLISLSLSYFNISFDYFVLFITAYYFSSCKNDLSVSYINCIWLIIASIVIRIASRYYFDDTWLYNQVVSSYTSNIMAISLILIMRKLLYAHSNHKMSHVFKFIETYSYYIYIVHYGIINMVYTTYNLTTATVVYIISVVIFSILLKSISSSINNRLVYPLLNKYIKI